MNDFLIYLEIIALVTILISSFISPKGKKYDLQFKRLIENQIQVLKDREKRNAIQRGTESIL